MLGFKTTQVLVQYAPVAPALAVVDEKGAEIGECIAKFKIVFVVGQTLGERKGVVVRVRDRVVCVEYEDVVGFVKHVLQGERAVMTEILPCILEQLTRNVFRVEKGLDFQHRVVGGAGVRYDPVIKRDDAHKMR